MHHTSQSASEAWMCGKERARECVYTSSVCVNGDHLRSAAVPGLLRPSAPASSEKADKGRVAAHVGGSTYARPLHRGYGRTHADGATTDGARPRVRARERRERKRDLNRRA